MDKEKVDIIKTILFEHLFEINNTKTRLNIAYDIKKELEKRNVEYNTINVYQTFEETCNFKFPIEIDGERKVFDLNIII